MPDPDEVAVGDEQVGGFCLGDRGRGHVQLGCGPEQGRDSDTVVCGRQKEEAESMKEELFELESERLRGAISAEEYASTKQAMTQSISRILARSNH